MAIEFIEEVKRSVTSNLPTDASIVGDVIKIIFEKSSSATDLADVIERDPPLTADILKVANSAYYGSSSQITSLKRAVVVLGFDTIKEIVTNTTVANYFFDTEAASNLDRSGLWLHSVGTAKASQYIAQKMGLERPDVAYTVGLLHDIGKILLSLTFPDNYGAVVDLAAEKKCRIILAEQKILNTDHCMIGKILCDVWGLPSDITTAIFFHHEPMQVAKGSQMLARVVSLGDIFCRKAQIGNPGDEVVWEPSPGLMGTFGKTRDAIRTRYQEIYAGYFAMKDDITTYFG